MTAEAVLLGVLLGTVRTICATELKWRFEAVSKS